MTPHHPPPAFALPASLLSRGFALRPESDEDIPFLMRLYASTRAHELASIPWSAEQKQIFLASQFEAQRRHYRAHFAGCSFGVIAHSGIAAGRFYLDAGPARLHVVDIALLPGWRGQGVGTAIVEALQAYGRAGGKGVGLFVEKSNPALRLYRRLGFTDVADHEVYLEMEWLPQSAQLNVAS